MFADLPDARADTHITPQPLDGTAPRRQPEEPQAGSRNRSQAFAAAARRQGVAYY